MEGALLSHVSVPIHLHYTTWGDNCLSLSSVSNFGITGRKLQPLSEEALYIEQRGAFLLASLHLKSGI